MYACMHVYTLYWGSGGRVVVVVVVVVVHNIYIYTHTHMYVDGVTTEL
jgi:hypothetical protein